MVLAAIFAPKGSADVILTGWYNGLFSILAFAFQMMGTYRRIGESACRRLQSVVNS